MSLPKEILENRENLMSIHRSKFPIWRLLLRRGFSLLLYGVGSKRSLLDEFMDKQLIDGGVVRINGHTGKNVNIKNVLITIIDALRCKTPEDCKGLNVQALVEIIEDSSEENYVYLVVHNIEYGGLGTEQNQRILGNLAAMKNIHVVATVDHINCDLLWDADLRSKFRWFRQQVTTYLPYTEEIKSQPKLIKNIQKQANEQRVKTILQTLPIPAKKVFLMLGQHALENPEEAAVLFVDLFEECQKQWILSNEQILRSYLTEFLDHELVLRVEESDEEERIQIALESKELETIVEMLEDEFDQNEKENNG